MIGGVAYAAAERGNNCDARVLCLDGIGAGGEEGSGPGPDVVVADDGAVRIDVEYWCYGVAAKLDVEPRDFQGVDETLECVAGLFFQMFGDALTDSLEEGKGGLVVPYFIYHVANCCVVHGRDAFNAEHVFWAARVYGRGAEGDHG